MSASSSQIMTPLFVSVFVVVTAYLMKKDEKDPSKTPNYLVLFLVSLSIVWAMMTFFSSAQDGGNVNIAMQEIDIGEPPF